MVGIYKITSPNNKVYIGQSSDINRRFKEYKRVNCRNQIRLYNSFKKYGVKNHIFEIIEECSIDELSNRERYWQEYYNSISKKSGLNCMFVNSNDKPMVLSEETKNKISKGLIGKKQSEYTKIKRAKSIKRTTRAEGYMSPNLGKKHTKEARNKISNHQKGRSLNKKWKNNISNSLKMVILDVQTGVFYFGLQEASESSRFSKSSIEKMLRGVNKNKTNLKRV